MSWSAVLFDLDGTLADTVPLIIASARHAMSVHYGEEDRGEEWQEYIGRPLRDTLRAFTRDEAEAERLRRTYAAFQDDAHDRMVRPFPGAVEIVRELERLRIPMAIVTSKGRRMAARTLEVCGLGSTFPVLVTADDVVNGKPDPEPVHRALDGLAMEPSGEVVFVGDASHDVESGREAGIRTVAVTWGAFRRDRLEAVRPDHLIDEMDDLRRILLGTT